MEAAHGINAILTNSLSPGKYTALLLSGAASWANALAHRAPSRLYRILDTRESHADTASRRDSSKCRRTATHPGRRVKFRKAALFPFDPVLRVVFLLVYITSVANHHSLHSQNIS